jgi:VWFA-related protein
MKIHALGVAFCLLAGLGLAVTVNAQFGAPQGTPQGMPGGPGRGAPSNRFPAPPDSPANQTDQAPTIKTETILVPVRVVVRKPNGHAVADLKKEDFKLYQDGKQQQIEAFAAIDNSAPAAPAGAGTASAGASTGNTDSSGAPVAAAAEPVQFVALFFDDVHSYFADTAQIREAAKKYLATLHPEDRVAIVTASGEGALDFTNDRDKLEEAMGKLRARPYPGWNYGTAIGVGSGPCPPAMTGTEAYAIEHDNSQPVLTVAAGDFAGCYHLSGMADPLAGANGGAAVAKAAAAGVQSANEMAADAILGQMERAVRRLSAMPGRRVIVMISPGFVYGGRQKQFAEIISLANHYNVVINTLDSKGLYMDAAKYDPDRFERFGYGHFQMEQPVLEDLADGTGGRFVKNNNDFTGVMREMGEAPEAYYLLSYAPHDLPADGKYHVLKVSLAGHSLDSVQARKGFYAPDEQETPEQAAKREIDDAIFSDDEQNDLPVKFETQLTTDASGAQKLAVKADIDVSRLNFQIANGANHENLVLNAALFDNDGNYIQGVWKSDQMDLKDATLAELKKTGFYLELDLDVKPGDYVVRMVARDSNEGHISAQSSNVTVPTEMARKQ